MHVWQEKTNHFLLNSVKTFCIVAGQAHLSGMYLVQVQHLVPPYPSGSFDILHGQCEVDPSGVRQVEVIGVILVPLLHRRKNLLLISADDV